MDKDNHYRGETALLEAVAAGDHQAYRQLFGQYWPQVYGTCLRLTKSAELSKDLAQDIFIKVWDQRLRLAGVENTDAFLYTVARNTVMDHFRKRVLDPGNDAFFQAHFQGGTPSPEQQMEYKELEASLQEAIWRLPPQLREVFKLSRLEGMSHMEIAKEMQISLVSSKTYIVRALAALRKNLGK